MRERLQKVLANAGVASRRKCEELILAGKVKVNGKVINELGAKADIGRDTIIVEGQKLERSTRLVYILLNKSKGVVSSVTDPSGRKTVVDVLHSVKERVYPVGRLDYNTEGLLLLTNDGDLTYALTHPKHQITKVYRARVTGVPTDETLEKLATGVKLEDGMTAPATIGLIDTKEGNAVVEFHLTEGRNRQVRRMCEAVGHPVISLKRVQVAFLTLKGVPRGRYRFLTRGEVERLKRMAKTTTDQDKGR